MKAVRLLLLDCLFAPFVATHERSWIDWLKKIKQTLKSHSVLSNLITLRKMRQLIEWPTSWSCLNCVKAPALGLSMGWPMRVKRAGDETWATCWGKNVVREGEGRRRMNSGSSERDCRWRTGSMNEQMNGGRVDEWMNEWINKSLRNSPAAGVSVVHLESFFFRD